MNGANPSNVGHHRNFELVLVFAEELLEVGSLRLRSEGCPDGVALLEESVNDMNGGETVRTGDEDPASWSDGWHGLGSGEEIRLVRVPGVLILESERGTP